MILLKTYKEMNVIGTGSVNISFKSIGYFYGRITRRYNPKLQLGMNDYVRITPERYEAVRK